MAFRRPPRHEVAELLLAAIGIGSALGLLALLVAVVA